MVTLVQAPPAYTFSGNFISLKFETDKYFEQVGGYAINVVKFLPNPVPEGATLTLTYGGRTVSMIASSAPDDSGTQFPTGDGSLAYVSSILPYFTANFQLNSDFLIEAGTWNSSTSGLPILNGRLTFTSRQKNYGYTFSNFSTQRWESFVAAPGMPDIVRPNIGIYFELYLEREDLSSFDRVYANKLPINYTNFQARASIDLSDILHNLLQNAGYDMPGFSATAPMACNKTCRRYYFQYAESYGEPVVVRALTKSAFFTVLLGKLSYVGAAENTLQSLLQPGLPDADRFLKQGSVSIVTLPTQPQFLYYFNSRGDAAGARLRINFFITNSTQPISKTIIFDCLQYRKYAFNFRFDQIFSTADNPGATVLRYEAWLEKSNGNHISQIVSYTLDYSNQQYIRYFLYLSSWGAMETLSCTGKAEIKQDLSYKEADRKTSPGYLLPSGETVVFDVNMQDSYKVATGWLTKPDLIQLRDFLTAAKKYRYNKGRMLPIAITAKTLDEMKDGDNLFSQTLEYKYLFADDAYTERTADEAELLTDAPKILSIYYGPAAAVPATPEQVQNLPFSHPETTYEFTINTGLNKTIVLCLPESKSLSSVFDNQSKENLTLSYKLIRKINIDGTDYSVLALQNAVAYTFNHEHLTTIKNG